MLRHVRAEQVGIREVVQRPVQRGEDDEQRPGKGCDLAPRRLEASQIHVEPAQEDEPDHDGGMQVPGTPGGHTPARRRTAPKKRNSRPITTTSARRSGPPNRNMKKRLSNLRCM